SVVSLLFVVAMGACGNFGSCGACGSTAPLPNGRLPTDQTVEGGAQIRVTPQGFQKITAIIPGIINDSFAGGFCLPNGDIGGSFLGAEYCHQNQGGCTNACQANVQIAPGGFTLSTLNNPQRLRIGLTTNVNMAIPIRGWAGCVSGLGCAFQGSCTVNVNSPA